MCAVSGLPASAAAGAQLGLRVTVQDAFGNVASGYTGTVALSSSDPAALLSAPAALVCPNAVPLLVANVYPLPVPLNSTHFK